MDWLEGMNGVVEYIEANLDKDIDYGIFGKMLCCSTYEFSRVFSFIAGISVSEYIRRRRLSQAALDIQGGLDKMIDIALKYGYESHAAFSRAFKEMHGQKPLSARKDGVSLKTYPKISFALIIRGVNEMVFRMERKESFRIIGKRCTGGYDRWCGFDKEHLPYFQSENLIRAPLWYVGAYFLNRQEEESCIIGAQLEAERVIEGMDVEVIQAAAWAVFPFTFRPGEDAAGETYAKVLTQWLPTSNYVRDESVPYLEVYGHEEDCFEIWVPVIKREGK